MDECYKVEMDESSSNPYSHIIDPAALGWFAMINLLSLADGAIGWLNENIRSFGYLLPDSLELTLYILLVTYFAIQLAQNKA